MHIDQVNLMTSVVTGLVRDAECLGAGIQSGAARPESSEVLRHAWRTGKEVDESATVREADGVNAGLVNGQVTFDNVEDGLSVGNL
jgi:hypothetical protein